MSTACPPLCQLTFVVDWPLSPRQDYWSGIRRNTTLASSTPVCKCVNDNFRGSLTKMSYMLIGGTSGTCSKKTSCYMPFVRGIFHIVHICSKSNHVYIFSREKNDVSRLTCRMIEGPTSIVAEIQRNTGCRLHIERGSTEVHCPKISGNI